MADPLSRRYGTWLDTGSLMLETAGTGINVIDFRAADFQTGFNDAMLRNDEPRTGAALTRLQRRMHGAPMSARAADDLVRATRLSRFVPRSLQRAVIRSDNRVH